jgi:hypothetical protein
MSEYPMPEIVIPSIIKLFVDECNKGGIFTVSPVEFTTVDGLLGLVATVNLLGHEREIFVSNEECECMAFIDGDNPVEKNVWRAFGSEEVRSILRDLRINEIMCQEEKQTGT